jgi:phospholipid transport system substrate-binding protein
MILGVLERMCPSVLTHHRLIMLLRLSCALLVGLGIGLGFAQAAEVQSDPSSVVEDPSALKTDSPTAVVANLQQGLLWIMKNAKTLGFQGRYDYLLPIVQKDFDVAFMGSKSVGRHWKGLDAEQQGQWLGQFADYLTSNYAAQFKGWDGESFELLGEEPAPRDTQVVLTRLVVPGGDDVILNYRLRKNSAGQWRIIDIYLKGTVSELALRRSDFSSILKNKGFGALVLAMNKKVAELRREGGG